MDQKFLALDRTIDRLCRAAPARRPRSARETLLWDLQHLLELRGDLALARRLSRPSPEAA